LLISGDCSRSEIVDDLGASRHTLWRFVRARPRRPLPRSAA
jgi:hypothetical protein